VPRPRHGSKLRHRAPRLLKSAAIGVVSVALSSAFAGGCKSKDGEDGKAKTPDEGNAQGAPGGGEEKQTPWVDSRDKSKMRNLVVDGVRCDRTGKREQQVDLNHDSRADLITLFATGEGNEITCKQADLNFDGRLDAFFHYGDGGELEREQFDLDFDGRIDMGRNYKNGQLVMDEQDLNLDGYVDAWRVYDKGKLIRIETDRDGDGRADMFTYYVGNQIDRIGYDVNGDGKVDQWDHDAASRARLALERRKEKQKTEDQTEDAEFVDEGEEGSDEKDSGEKDSGKKGSGKKGSGKKGSGKKGSGKKGSGKKGSDAPPREPKLGG
jgi:hypothetical protein